MRVNEDSENWVVIGTEPGSRQLAFQRSEHWVPPARPDPQRPQQMHLDIRVDHADAAERAVPPSEPGASQASGKGASASSQIR